MVPWTVFHYLYSLQLSIKNSAIKFDDILRKYTIWTEMQDLNTLQCHCGFWSFLCSIAGQIFVFDFRSNSDEDFELELFTYIYRHISIYLISMGNAYSASFNIQVDIRIDILK